MISAPLTSTLFPYTTLFRSRPLKAAWFAPASAPAAATVSTAKALASVYLKLLEAVVMLAATFRSEEHTSELESHSHVVCRLLPDVDTVAVIAALCVIVYAAE